MDDTSMFLQWAMNQQLHQHPAAAAVAAAAAAAGAPAYPDGGGGGGGGGAGETGAAFPSLQALRSASQSQLQPAVAAGVRAGDLTVQVDHRASSWSSGDSPGTGATAMDHDAAASAGWSPHTTRAMTTGLGGGSNSRTMSWNFGAASAQPADESGGAGVALPDAAAAAARSAGRRAGGGSSSSPRPAAAAAAASSPGPVQDHIIAERRRREKINQRFIELSTVIPGLKKMDKATILGDAVKYVRELQEKVKTLEEDGAHNAGGGGGAQSAVAVVVKKPCRLPNDEAAESSSGGGGLPEIEARLSDKNVLLRIHCDNARGLLVRLLSEVEKMSLAITHTNVMPFPASTAIITITAKVQEGFNATVDEIARQINSVLDQYHSSSTEETRT